VTSSIALVTCTDIPDLEPDDQLLIEPLRERGVDVTVAIWDDPSVDWTSFDLVMLRSPWDYTPRRDEFVAWAASVPRLVNPAAIVAWNTDKRYLSTLEAAGAQVVDTAWVAPESPEWDPPAAGEWVIKPTVSAGSRDTGRYDLSVSEHRDHAVAHLDRLLASGRVAMIQPYLTAVDTYGETALMFFNGTFSHAIRKGPMLEGPDLGVSGLYKPEAIISRVPSEAELDAARQVLAALPADLPMPLYARVDLIPGASGVPTLVELELTEPSLFLEHGAGAADRLADALVGLL
jgi:hypothetical protein